MVAPKQRQGIELDFEDTTEAQIRLEILDTGVSFEDGSSSKECNDFVSKVEPVFLVPVLWSQSAIKTKKGDIGTVQRGRDT